MGRHRWSVGRQVLVRRAIAAACVIALLGAAVAIGIAWGWADHGHRASASVPAAPPATPASGPAIGSATPSTAESLAPAPSVADSTDWLAVLGALDRSRDGAFADADAAELDAIYVPGSDALKTDRATLGRLVSAGQRVRGLEFTLESARVVAQSPNTVALAVSDTLAAYDVVGANGSTESVAGRGERNWTAVLRADPVSSKWRIASIEPS